MLMMLMSACGNKGDFGTETRAVWCDALLRDAPTASRQDTEQTRIEVAVIGETIDALCKGEP